MTDAKSQDQAPPQAPEVDYVALQPGQTVGRYEIVSILGQGGFGITYRAKDAQLNREVAIKEYLPSALAVRQDGVTVLPRSTKMSDDFTWGRQRFVDEGRTLATLQRAPAIVRVFDFLEANGTAYIIMELVPGKTLEDRLKDHRLGPAEVDRILWPLLEGLEQVHATGFLHRDIKPANILLDDSGNPTLIDFGASRAAMAGRTTAMTAIFTPGYAAAEQFTSAKQGPWTDIYGVSATLYHAITGAPPPSAFDRMLDDEYQPITRLAPAGFTPGLLVGIDAGLAVRATDRPQSIEGWRPLLGQTGAPDANATVALRAPQDGATVVSRSPLNVAPATVLAPAPLSSETAAASPKRGKGLWAGLAAVVLLALAGGGYYVATSKAPQATATKPTPEEQAQLEAEAKRIADEQELARLRKEKADAEAKAKADAEAKQRADALEAEKRKVEEETKQKVEAELAAKQKADEEARLKAEADEQARLKAQEDDRRAAEAGENMLRLSPLDRQHIQVALTALNFNTNGTDGVFGGHTRDMITAWQKSRGYAGTGFFTAPEFQALQRDGAPAIAKFDDDQKKADEARKKAEADKAKADAAAAAAPKPAAPAPAPKMASAAPGATGTGPDGIWRGTYHCTPPKNGSGPFTFNVTFNVNGGQASWARPGSGPGTTGVQTISLHIVGARADFARLYIPNNTPDISHTGTLSGHYDQAAGTISASGPEANGAGRVCTATLNHQ
ncbi:MAG TPA: protein kinase [Reyranella sp.]|nr:protein kinase [Reyranella sp.]